MDIELVPADKQTLRQSLSPSFGGDFDSLFYLLFD